MIADHNETKAFRITFFPEMHIEQVEIVEKNQYLKIRILKQSKIRALESSPLECQNSQHQIEYMHEIDDGLVATNRRLREDLEEVNNHY